jgi:uncharacterized delta-60 repeat protein
MRSNPLLGGVLAAGLILSACSGDDDSADSGPTTTAAPEAELTGLDGSFGTDGVLATPLSATGHDRFITVAEGPDGKIYASGFTSEGTDRMFAVARFDGDGALDDSFGSGGIAAVNVQVGGTDAEVARGLIVEDDGKVVLSGPVEQEADAEDDQDVAVVRLEPDGSLDASFGDGGVARIDLGAGKADGGDGFATDNAWGITAREGGYAVSAVTANQATDRTDTDFAIVGITPEGQVDAGFGTDGVVIADVDGSRDSARNIHTLDDGSIMATGYSHGADEIVFPVLIKLSADGTLDSTFGDGGIVHQEVLAAVTESYQFVPQDDGFILVGYGTDDPARPVDMIVYRFTADGELDADFGEGGVRSIDLGGQSDRGRNVTILPDGSILVVGSGSTVADQSDALVVLLDPAGALVDSFGDAGLELVDLGGPADAFFGVTVASDGRAVYLAGFNGAAPDGPANDDAVLARIAL